MLAKRIIPCLDIKDGRTVKGTNFIELRDAGDPLELAIAYSINGADELVFLDITATNENRKTTFNLVHQLAENINIPFTVGGGIKQIEDIDKLMACGADKVSINTAASQNPKLITQAAYKYGSQAIVVAIDTKNINGNDFVFLNGGRLQTTEKTIDWAKKVESLGAGEILLTSMDADGTKAGFDLAITKIISTSVNIPVIASGGAGSIQHFIDVFNTANADAALAASIFHFKEIEIKDLKLNLQSQNINVRLK